MSEAMKTAGNESWPTKYDSVYELAYAQVKEAAFGLYLWGLRTDNDDAIDLYKRLLGVFRIYDEKFVSPDYKYSRRGGAS